MGMNAPRGPIIDKSTFDNIVGNMRFGVCEMQGWRKTMEDSSIAFPYFDKGNSVFGVMDGHGGKIISKFVSQNFLNILINSHSYKKGNYEQALIEAFLSFDEILQAKAVNSFLFNSLRFPRDANQQSTITTTFIKERKIIQYDDNIFNLSMLEEDNENYIQLLEKKYAENLLAQRCLTEEDDDEGEYYHMKGKVADQMGTTANVVLMTNNYIYIANVGDSLSVMYKNGKAIKLNQEHKITLESEYERIMKSGGKIINQRIEGKLNLTRAIGDFSLKNRPNLKNYEQSVTAYPEITKIKYTPDIEFIVMGCDGLWDCVDPQVFCQLLSERIQTEKYVALSVIISSIFDQIISKSNSGKSYLYYNDCYHLVPIGTDNMTCIIVYLGH